MIDKLNCKSCDESNKSSDRLTRQPGEGVYTPAFELSRSKLCKLSPESICESALCRYNPETNLFTLTSFGSEFEISYPGGKVYFAGTPNVPPTDWKLILLNHLSAVKKIPVSNDWVPYRELTGGNVFFPSIKNYVLSTLGNFFNQADKTVLKKALLDLGFGSVQHGNSDLAAVGFFAPRIPVMILFWEGEEDIPSSCQLLFDRTLSEQMHIEDAAALCSVVRDLLMKQYDTIFRESTKG